MAGFVLANGSMSSNQSGEGDIRRRRHPAKTHRGRRRGLHGGAARPAFFNTITTSTFEGTDVLLAPKEALLAFDRQVTPLFQQVRANLHQSRTLATLRDTLLPKLLSGELRVAESAA